MTSPIHYQRGSSNLILTIPHSAQEIPKRVKHNLDWENPLVQRTFTKGIDIASDRATGAKIHTSAHRIWTELPRAIVDVCRFLTSIDRHASEQSDVSDPHGLIWTATHADYGTMSPMLKEPYSSSDLMSLLSLGYFPYIEKVKSAMTTAVENHGLAIHLDLHSMPAQQFGKAHHGEFENAYLAGSPVKRGKKENELPDILMLGNPGEYCSTRIYEVIEEVFRKHDFLVRRGVVRQSATPSAKLYSDLARNKHSISFEIVSHDCEPGRIEGENLRYDQKGDKFLPAFKEVYKTIEALTVEDLK